MRKHGEGTPSVADQSAFGIEWDAGNELKCQKHSVTIHEIEMMFYEGDVTVFYDPFPHEVRLRAIGKTSAGRDLLVVYTLRKRGDKRYIRPISARYMHAKETLSYEKDATARPSDG